MGTYTEKPSECACITYKHAKQRIVINGAVGAYTEMGATGDTMAYIRTRSGCHPMTPHGVMDCKNFYGGLILDIIL